MATSMIKQAITSITAQAQAIPYAWVEPKAKSTVLFQDVKIWNNQIARQEKGDITPSDYPQAYVEPILGPAIKLGLGVTMYPEAIFRVHIADWFFDAMNGTENQDLDIFDWRDLVKSQLQLFFPTYCGPLTVVNENQDFDHEGVYHYTIDFKCNFTDSKGGQEDPDQTSIISIYPIEVQETIEFNDEIADVVRTLYGWGDCMIIATIAANPDNSVQILDNGDVIPVQYALNNDGTLTIPELASYYGIGVLTPFLLNSNSFDQQFWDANTNKFDISSVGTFSEGDEIAFNARLPFYVPF